MHVLILGLSSIAQRRVIPALALSPRVTAVDVASRSKPAPANWGKSGEFYADYREAISRSAADLIYVSLPNAHHVAWIDAGLEAGKHVIVDKPATPTLAEARRCADNAARRSLLLAEATVFAYHTQFAALRAFVAEHGLTQIDAQFIIPPLPIENFRNHRALGGGCLQDMGAYAAAIPRLLGARATSLCAVGAPPASDRDIDMGFSILAGLTNGVRYSGHFSFESEYRNQLTLIGPNGAVEIERVFSPPAEHEPVWKGQLGNRPFERRLPASDAFGEFLAAVFEAIGSGAHDHFLADLVSDAAFRARIEAALGDQRFGE